MFFTRNVDKAHSQLSLKLQHPKLFGDHPNVSRRKSLNPGYQVSFLIPKSESPRLDGQLLECRTQNLLSPKEIFLSLRKVNQESSRTLSTSLGFNFSW
ncbi:hypothetical protein CDAR_591351 [Caerostris darwini]|uniref:Uncharacterized protein n=1 Tax=Caerostris darwini TaxID=1538125 RepID=A0AAV4NSK3_9ARAC|nr:hypothetical protein CDAR_591351 [Caerostris darwini]